MVIQIHHCRHCQSQIADHLYLHVVPRWNGDTNFMPVLADVKVLPDALENTCRKLREAWASLE